MKRPFYVMLTWYVTVNKHQDILHTILKIVSRYLAARKCFQKLCTQRLSVRSVTEVYHRELWILCVFRAQRNSILFWKRRSSILKATRFSVHLKL